MFSIKKLMTLKKTQFIMKSTSNAFCTSPLKPPEIKKCYYETLNISKNANKHEIKENYLKLECTILIYAKTVANILLI